MAVAKAGVSVWPHDSTEPMWVDIPHRRPHAAARLETHGAPHRVCRWSLVARTVMTYYSFPSVSPYSRCRLGASTAGFTG